MQDLDDLTLLHEYATRDSEAAFAELVSRRIGFVYSAALRQVRDPHVAEEITQAVFIILAQKAGRISNKTILAGWLFKTTRYAAFAQIRAEMKHARQEKEFQMQTEIQSAATDETWNQMSPLLDEALASLGETDRQAVLLRFFENKSFAEVGNKLGTGEDTARKRIARALEKLHRFFSKRGVSSTTAMIAGALSINSVQAAPVGLAKMISTGAVAKGVTASTSTLILIKGALKIMTWSKAKPLIIAGVGIFLIAGTTIVTMKEIPEHYAPVWQEKFDLSFVDRLPPQIKLLPSLPSTLQSGLHVVGSRNGKALGLGQSVPDLLMMAYGVGWAQIIWNTSVPEGKYDFIANFSNPLENIKAGQEGIQKMFGLTVRRETLETNVLILTVLSRNAAGLKRSAGQFSGDEQSDSFSAHDQNLWTLVDYLQRCSRTMVIDRTELTGNYDIDFNWDSTPEGLKQVLNSKLGLELVPTNMPIEMLFVEKVK